MNFILFLLYFNYNNGSTIEYLDVFGIDLLKDTSDVINFKFKLGELLYKIHLEYLELRNMHLINGENHEALENLYFMFQLQIMLLLQKQTIYENMIIQSYNNNRRIFQFIDKNTADVQILLSAAEEKRDIMERLKTKIKKNSIKIRSKNLKRKSFNAVVIKYKLPSKLINFNIQDLQNIMLSPDYEKIKTEPFEINENDKNIIKISNIMNDTFCLTNKNATSFQFILKKEFIMLQYIMPELIPFIYFINYCELNNNMLNTKLKTYNHSEIVQSFSDWSSILKDISYKNAFNDIKMPVTTFKLIFEFVETRDKIIILNFRKFLSDFLELIIDDKELITNYKFIIKMYEIKITGKLHNMSLECLIFYYFIINLKQKNKDFMSYFKSFNTFTKQPISSLDIKEYKKVFNCLHFFMKKNIMKTMLENYEQMTKTLTIEYDDYVYNGFMKKFNFAIFRGQNIYFNFQKMNNVVYKRLVTINDIIRKLMFLFNHSLVYIERNNPNTEISLI